MDGVRGHAVLFDRYGGPEQLYLADQPVPEPLPGDVVVAVVAAGVNPVDDLIRSGARPGVFSVRFPAGQGSDLAGIVVATGAAVRHFAPGDAVLGWSRARRSHAGFVAVPESDLVPKPDRLDWLVAGSLFMVGSTAHAAVAALDPQPGQTVAVSAAAGGVGALVVQLLVRRGVRVLGIAGPRSAEWLTQHGVTPVPYGPQAPDLLRAQTIDAFIDLFGPDYLDLALDLGIAPDRIETTAAIHRGREIGAHTAGSPDGASAGVLADLAGTLAAGEIDLPIAAVFPLERVRDAFVALRSAHAPGKVVLVPDHRDHGALLGSEPMRAWRALRAIAAGLDPLRHEAHSPATTSWGAL